MAKACDLKRGSIVTIAGNPHMLETLKVSSPTARGSASMYHLRFRNLSTKVKVDKSCKGDESFGDCSFEKKDVQFSYSKLDIYTFMVLDDYSEITFNKEDIEDELQYITEDLEGIQVLISDEKAIGLQLPKTAELEVTACDPSMRGASATARTKPATLTTGLIVQVPEYLAPGETIKVDTKTGAFLGRV